MQRDGGRSLSSVKTDLTCHQADWFDALPLILLGIRTVLREDLNFTATELIYGSSLRQTARIYAPRNLETCSHVFLLRYPFKKALQTPYEGPFKVVRRLTKDLNVLVKAQERLISMDRSKPVFFLYASDHREEESEVSLP
ncbi:hypothetical protein AVEN_189760-1 [Araneus ventricosus]|uniref:Uncharacterized protein n=1 Tax=Araneus ventricosus TaxID=182803 RepID=A0A4Y2SRT9_ARAVE|nr:hypothetical protein AVEN_189760-1 [Araneus ventricosus]